MTETVLIADDDPDIVSFVRADLRSEGFEVHGARDGEEAIAAARRLRPECVILDIMMPALDGIRVCRALRADPRTNHCAIIMLTAKTFPADKIEGLSSGADDYIVKPFNPPELVARVKSTLRRRREMRETSPLTGLPGNFAVSRELQIRIDDGQDFAVIHADIDNFKAFNDRYGFVRGDRAIGLVADVLVDVVDVGAGRFVGHIGGDDFVVLCPGAEADDICRRATETFDARVGDLYDEEDRTSGRIELIDRAGEVHSYPLLTLSLGVAQAANRRFGSQAEAASVATEMKNFAKRRPGSAYEIDRRSDDVKEDPDA